MTTSKIETLRKLIDHCSDNLDKSEIDHLHDLLSSEIDKAERSGSESARNNAEYMYSVHADEDTLDLY